VYVLFDVDEETPVQWVGVHPLRWRPAWGEPTAMFREAERVDIANIPEVKALVDAVRVVVQGAQKDIYTPGCTCSACTRRARLADALAAFKAAP